MGKAKKTRKFAVTKKIISTKDPRVKSISEKVEAKKKEQEEKAKPKQVEQAVSALFFQYNTQLGVSVLAWIVLSFLVGDKKYSRPSYVFSFPSMMPFSKSQLSSFIYNFHRTQ